MSSAFWRWGRRGERAGVTSPKCKKGKEMILKLNNNSYKKIILCMLMITLLIMIQCVYPIVEAHAVAASAAVVIGGALATILLMIGVKLLPKTNVSLSKIYNGIINVVESAGEAVYPALTWLFDEITEKGMHAGNVIKIAATKLTQLKNELFQILGTNKLLVEQKPYTGSVMLQDAKITVSEEILYGYDNVVAEDTEPAEFDIKLGQKIGIKGRFVRYYNGMNNAIMDYVDIKVINNPTYYTISFDFYGIYSNGSAENYQMNYSIDKVNPGESLRLKFDTQAGVNLPVNLSYFGRVGKITDERLKVQVYEGETEIGTIYPSYATANYYIPKSQEYEVTYSKYVSNVIDTKAKIIPGVYENALDIAENGDGIDIVLPDTLVPRMDSVCPDLKTRLDTLNPSIDIDDDIVTRTWDDELNEELPDVVDGTPDVETGDTEIKDMPEQEDLELPAIITNKFPFSIPWDVKRAIDCLVSAPEVPKFTIPFCIDSIGIDEEVEIDLSEFETVAAICRWFTTLSVCFGLILATRKLIGQ